MKHCAVLATGFVALDVISTPKASGPTAEVGGSCANVACALAALGTSVGIIARVGMDPDGEHVTRELAAKSIDTTSVRRDPAIRTPRILHLIGNGSDHRFLRVDPATGRTLPRWSAIEPEDVQACMRAFAPPRVLYFDRISETILRLAEWVRAAGGLVFFEPSSVKDPELFAAAIGLADVVKFSDERLGGGPCSSAAVPLVVRTLGASGVAYRHHDGQRAGDWSHMSAPAARYVVDSAGAGDLVTAALVHRLTARAAALHDPAETADALALGQSVAARNCAYYGAQGLLRDLGHAGFAALVRQLSPVKHVDRPSPAP